MKSEIEWRNGAMIRAVLAAAFACALAFAFALCLPTTKAFAEVTGPMQTANGNGSLADGEHEKDNLDNNENLAVEGGEKKAEGTLAACAITTDIAAGDSPALDGTGNADDGALGAEEVSDDWEYEITDGKAVLKSYKGADKTTVTVPGSIEGKSVVIDKDAFYDMSDTLEKVVFSAGVKIKDGSKFFAGFSALKTVVASGLDLSECTSMEAMFYGAGSLVEVDLSGSDASKCETMDGMFAWCTSLTTVNAANLKLNTTGPLNMHTMFLACESLSELDTTNWDMSGVTNMANMFDGCKSLAKLDVSKWNTGSVTTMQSMFNNCESLTALDVSGWDVGKVTSFQWAFNGLPGTTVLDVRKWKATSVEPDSNGYYNGWTEAFHGPLVLVSDGQMAQRVESGKNRADGKYIGVDYYGYYGIFLEDSMDRVWCLNFGIASPSGNLYTRHVEQLDEMGLQRLSTVFSYADTQMGGEDRWKKIAAAITFFGNVLDADVQANLQDTIWYYSDNLYDPVNQEKGELDEGAQAMVDYVEANWQSLDYSGLKINFYDSDTNPTVPNDDGTYNGKFQNLISLSTAETVKHKGAGELVISKEIATGSNADTDQVFTFTVRLKNADGTPYVMFVQAASEGEELHTVAPSQDGVITLTITGAGEAVIANLRPGTTYEIVEESVAGWTLIGKSGEKGTIGENTTSTATFTNAEKGKEHLANKEEAKTEDKAATKAMAAKGGMAQTGDNTVVWPLIALALGSLVTLVVARRKQKEH